MDSATKWLLRIAAFVLIAAGGTGTAVLIGQFNKSSSDTKISSNNESRVTVDLDKIRNTGNTCPSFYGYIGGGYCQEVSCFYSGWSGKHDGRLGGKGWACKGGNVLKFSGPTVRATTDERCPMEEPEIGRNRSCDNGKSEKELFSGGMIWK